MATLNDLKLASLRGLLSVADGQTTQLEVEALKFKGATGEQLNDLWMDYLVNVATLPQQKGQLNDMQFSWLGALGYVGSLNDRWMQFWAAPWPV